MSTKPGHWSSESESFASTYKVTGCSTLTWSLCEKIETLGARFLISTSSNSTIESPSSSVTVTEIENKPSSIQVQLTAQLFRINRWLAVERVPSSYSISNSHQTFPPSSSNELDASIIILSFVHAIISSPIKVGALPMKIGRVPISFAESASLGFSN